MRALISYNNETLTGSKAKRTKTPARRKLFRFYLHHSRYLSYPPLHFSPQTSIKVTFPSFSLTIAQEAKIFPFYFYQIKKRVREIFAFLTSENKSFSFSHPPKRRHKYGFAIKDMKSCAKFLL
jgi:hypothetical protein